MKYRLPILLVKQQRQATSSHCCLQAEVVAKVAVTLLLSCAAAPLPRRRGRRPGAAAASALAGGRPSAFEQRQQDCSCSDFAQPGAGPVKQGGAQARQGPRAPAAGGLARPGPRPPSRRLGASAPEAQRRQPRRRGRRRHRRRHRPCWAESGSRPSSPRLGRRDLPTGQERRASGGGSPKCPRTTATSGSPDSAQSAGAAESPSSRAQGGGGQGRREGKRGSSSKRSSKLKGKREGVKGCACEISSSGSDSFTKASREVAERAGRAITGAGELRAAAADPRAGGELEPAPPGGLAAPDFATRAGARREDRRARARRAESRLKVKQRAFPAALGQRDPAARPRVEAAAGWGDVSASSDVAGAPRLAGSCEVQRQARRGEASALLGSERRLAALRRSNLASGERCQALKGKVEAAGRLGAAAGEKPDLACAKLSSAAADPGLPAEAERQAAAAAAKEERLSRLLLFNGDKKRCAPLVRDAENERARGANSCPEALPGARDRVASCAAPRAPSRRSGEAERRAPRSASAPRRAGATRLPPQSARRARRWQRFQSRRARRRARRARRPQRPRRAPRRARAWPRQ